MTLLARYTLDGNAKDSEGTAHGTAIDVTWAPSQLVDGGGEARLNGTTSRIETGVTFTTETAASLPIWFRPHEGAGHLVGQHDGTDGLAIEQTETGKIRLVVNATASAEVTVYPGEYHHAVPVYDAGEATLYLDGVSVASVMATVTWPVVPVTLGGRADGSAALECDVVNVTVHDSVEPPSTVPNAGLIAWYAMDDMWDSTLRDELSAHDATVYNAALEDGVIGNAFRFNGTNSYAGPVDFPALDSGQVPFSFSGWFKTAVRKRQYIFCSGVTIGIYARIHEDGKFLFKIDDDTNDAYEYTDAPLDDGLWHHFCCANDGAEIKTFIDGDLKVSVPHTVAGFTFTGIAIGAPVYSGVLSTADLFEGELDQLRVYDRALTEAEVQGLWNEPSRGGPFEISGVAARSTSGVVHVLSPYNPHPTPIPNPTAIPRSGRSSVQGISALLAPPAGFDQRDGSGGSPLSPGGVVSRPDRQGRLSGNTTDDGGQPVSRRVRCFERKTGRLVRETWSNAAGYYQFDDLDPAKRFTVVAHDHTDTYNAVIADNVQPEVPA